MEKKTFSKIEISVIKSTAKNVSKYVAMKEKIEAQIKEVEEKVAEQIRKRASEKIEKLEAEKAGYQSIIDSMNAPVKQITNGYTTEDLVDVKRESTGQIDPKSGKDIMKTVYVLKYPETVVPVNNEEPTVEEGSEAAPEIPTTADGPGSDFDVDKENVLAENLEKIPEEVLAEMDEKVEEAPEAEADPFANDGWN